MLSQRKFKNNIYFEFLLTLNLKLKQIFLKKSRNVLLTKEKNAKLADFGLSRMIDFDITLSDNTNCLTPIGTHQYKSPEMRNGKKYDYKTDIWYLF